MVTNYCQQTQEPSGKIHVPHAAWILDQGRPLQPTPLSFIWSKNMGSENCLIDISRFYVQI